MYKLAPVVMISSLAALAAAAPAWTDERPCDACGKPTPWDRFNAADLKVTVPGQPGYGSWHIEFDNDSHDIQVTVDMSNGEQTSRGRIMMVGGRKMATQGPITQSGAEIDALDEPILMRLLLSRVLGRALPDGPAGLHGTRTIDFSDAKTGIQFATPSAQGYIPAPWSVHGVIDVVSADRIGFDLVVKAVLDDDTDALDQHLEGALGKLAKATIDDATPLEGWSVFEVGAHMQKSGDGALIDYGAGPSTSSYKTVADIRRELAAEDHPGQADPRRDFTGFWKDQDPAR